jgi:hypothetical protein
VAGFIVVNHLASLFFVGCYLWERRIHRPYLPLWR